jgi:hypothetical protein
VYLVPPVNGQDDLVAPHPEAERIPEEAQGGFEEGEGQEGPQEEEGQVLGPRLRS